MAAGLGFKDFVTGEVLTAADVDGYLMQGVWVFASAAARTSAVASPQEGNMCYLKDTNSVEYYSGSAWTAVSGGGGGGKVLQVVNATYATAATSSSSSYADTGLTATITPTLNTSKVLVIVNQFCLKSDSNTAVGLKLLRGATELSNFGVGAAYTNDTSFVNIGTVGFTYQDSPATTSATTYKTTFNSYNSSAQAKVNDGGTSSITLLEIGA